MGYKFNPFTGALDITGKSPSDVAYDSTTWNSNTDSPTKNSVRDQLEIMLTSISGKFAFDSVAISGDTNLVAGKFYNVNASGGLYSGTLPSGVINTFVGICDPTGSFATNKFGVSGGAGKINGISGSAYYIFAPFFSGIFYCYNGTDWILI